jgi:hypothetical protein
MNDASGNSARESPKKGDYMRQHVRQMLAKLRNKLRVTTMSVDYTVEVDRDKSRSGGVDGA